MGKKESAFQHKVIKEIKELYPGSVVIKTDPNYIQGFPDLLILYKNKWASLECKRDRKAEYQPNQEYYVNKLNQMSFAATLYPENKEEVMRGLQSAFGS